MDLVLVLDRLTQQGRLQIGEDWGPCAQSDALYREFADMWRGTSPVPTQAELDAAWSQIEAAGGVAGLEKQRQRVRASEAVAANSVDSRVRRAVVALLVDELNSLRQWIAAFKVQVAAATNLADLKTRVAALPNTPDRTLGQAKAAIQAKANSVETD